MRAITKPPPLFFLRRDFLAVDRRGERHHVQTGALTPEEFQAIQDSGEGAGPEKGQHGFSAYDQVASGSAALRGDEDEEDQPVMIWNWLLPGDEAQRASDGEYSKRMMEMLAQNGAGLMDAGTPCAPLLMRKRLKYHGSLLRMYACPPSLCPSPQDFLISVLIMEAARVRRPDR